jgi:hypothetical protein
MLEGKSKMSKKLNYFQKTRPDRIELPTKRELIAASEYGKAPEYIARLAIRLAFLREKEVQDVRR